MEDMRKLDVAGHKVIVRVDFNVPLDQEFKVTDDTRIRGAIPTIKYLIDKGARVILLSHFERPLKSLLPNGEIDKVRFSLKNVLPALNRLLGKTVDFFPDTIGEQVQQKVNDLQNGDVILLENTRFYSGEEKGDPELAKRFASL